MENEVISLRKHDNYQDFERKNSIYVVRLNLTTHTKYHLLPENNYFTDSHSKINENDITHSHNYLHTYYK